MAKSTNRTRPLDRDGDGKDGGSLPGNKTAPMADTAAPADPVEQTDEGNPNFPDQGPPNSTATPPSDAGDELADVRTMPGDSPEKLQAIERETDEANAAARAAVEHEGYGEAEPELVAQVLEDHADTFDTEQVEAAADLVVGTDYSASPDTTIVGFAKGDTIAHALRLVDLRTLASSHFLYKSAEGYSPTYKAPYISEETAVTMIAAGVATFDADAGNCGALRPTVRAKYALADAKVEANI